MVRSDNSRKFAPGVVDESAVFASAPKVGSATSAVVAEIDNSRIHDFIDTSGGISNISTHFTVGLSGSELAQLHADGVPDPVLDALQKKTLAEFIEFHRLRYLSWGKGSIQK